MPSIWGYSGYSARSTRYSDRYSDRRARSISRYSGYYSNRYSDRRAVLIAVIAPDLDSRTKVRSSGYEPGFSYLIRDTNKLSTNFSPPSSSSTAL
ncbi:hypothetical protein L249_7572 [Ophiocordyceps polyrhachis-furcata BCC 54312]|uniref:Uncharacterized protein n=1 Tax=Ophiocordyceps polyrhachis-furcata BCC 54312 TaxID=1330021 RepID=A0A367LB91_9HYPO|nr:hypothetical protein L249_7572 [Ophiocordyceps polyrhachis-furcata BCC 54312]